MASQPCPQSHKEPVHKTMQAYTDTLCTTQRESNLTRTMFQNIPFFDGQDSSKLEDWFMDIKAITVILTESGTCLAKAKSKGLTFILIFEATQTGKCWNKIKSILILQLYNANIQAYTSCILKYNNRTMKA